MPLYLSLFVAVAFLGTLSIVWQRRWLAAQKQNVVSAAEQSTAAPASPASAGRVQQRFSALRSKLGFGAKRPDLSQRFRAWAPDAFAQDEQVRSWLAVLSPEAHTAFTHQVAEFCNEMGFELSALVDGQLGEIPAAAQQAETIVLQYCRANQQAAVAQDDFEAAKRFLAYLQAPDHKSNLSFGQALYGKLVAEKVVPPPSFDMLLASEEKRRANGLAAIHQAAAQDPAAFNTVLKAVILEGAMPPTEEKPMNTYRVQEQTQSVSA